MKPNHEEKSESEKFDAAMRRIVSVSKVELEKREKAWKRKKKGAKKKPTTP
jgi:hypothetical protein